MTSGTCPIEEDIFSGTNLKRCIAVLFLSHYLGLYVTSVLLTIVLESPRLIAIFWVQCYAREITDVVIAHLSIFLTFIY